MKNFFKNWNDVDVVEKNEVDVTKVDENFLQRTILTKFEQKTDDKKRVSTQRRFIAIEWKNCKKNW